MCGVTGWRGFGASCLAAMGVCHRVTVSVLYTQAGSGHEDTVANTHNITDRLACSSTTSSSWSTTLGTLHNRRSVYEFEYFRHAFSASPLNPAAYFIATITALVFSLQVKRLPSRVARVFATVMSRSA